MPQQLTLPRMYRALDAHGAAARDFQDQYAKGWNELLGRFYGRGDGKSRPLNLVARNVLTLVSHLAHRNPKHDVRASSAQHRGIATVRGLALDRVSDKLDRIKVTRMQLMRALIGPMAVTKIGHRSGAEMVTVNGRLYDPGMPYIYGIDFPDHVCDSFARNQNELTWEGHRYRVPRLEAQESGLFNPDVIANIPSVEEQDDGAKHRADRLPGAMMPGDEAVEMIELIDIVVYDPYGSYIVTMPGVECGAPDFLRVVDYQGPQRGPYEWLSFVPSNKLYPMPVLALWMEQGEAANALFAKMIDQVLRTKRLLAANRGQSDDLDTARQAGDGETIEVDDVQGLANVDIGGQTPDFAPFAQTLLAWSNMQYANIDIAAGQEGGTDKATIYQGMAANANAIIDDLQNTLEEYESRVSRALHWRMAKDPLTPVGAVHRLPGGEMIDVVFDPRAQEGNDEDFTIKIRYGSTLRVDPQKKNANLVALMDMAMRSMELTMATGGAWKTDAVLRIAGREMGFEELDEIIDDPILQMQRQIETAAAGPPAPGVPTGPTPGLRPQAAYAARPAPSGRQDGGGYQSAPRRAAQPVAAA